MTYKVIDCPSSEPILILFFGILFWWISNEILSRLFGFKNNIYQTKILKEYDQNMDNIDNMDNDVNNGKPNDDITNSDASVTIEIERIKSNSSNVAARTPTVESHSNKNGKHDGKSRMKLHERMSKRLDINNEYRIRINPIPWYLKSFFHLIILVIFLVDFVMDPDWHYDMYIIMNHESNNYIYLQYSAAIMVSFYIWENIIITKYGRLQRSAHVHHWLVALGGILIIIGKYNPFAVLYIEIGIGLSFMLPLCIGIRAHLSKKYPRFVRKVCTFTQYYYAVVTVLNGIGQMSLVINSQNTQSISILNTIIITVGIIGCLYDDIKSIKSLHEYSKQAYQHLIW